MRPVVLLVLALLTPRLAQAQFCPAPAGTPPTAVPEAPPQLFMSRKPILEARLRSGRFQAISLGDSNVGGWPMPLLQQAFGVETLKANMSLTTQQLLWQLDHMDFGGFRPRYVLVQIGAGDVRYDGCTVYQGRRAVAVKLRQMFPAAKIIFQAIPPRGPNLQKLAHRINLANAALAEAAPKLGIYVFDPHAATLCHNRTPCEYFRPDLLHFSPLGFEVLTRMLRDYVRALP